MSETIQKESFGFSQTFSHTIYIVIDITGITRNVM